jgi:phosphotransferase system enzyme I (PtsI)
MKCYSGKSVFPGIAFGRLYVLYRPELKADKSPSGNPDVEWVAFKKAKQQADIELEILFNKTLEEFGEEEANIVDIQRMMLEDGDFLEAVENFITHDNNRAAFAVSKAGKQFAEYFASLEDSYMNARSADIADVSQRLVKILLGGHSNAGPGVPSIVAADDLSPSEMLQFDKKYLQALVTRRGSLNSHTAILARTLKIPALVQVADISLDSRMNELPAVVDSHEGKVYFEPDEETKRGLEDLQRRDHEAALSLESFRGLPTITKDGHRIKLFANIGSVEDMESALSEDAEGIGLFRSEFLYLDRNDYPGEEDQFEVYRRVAERMGERKVIIRTMDIGADKKADYLGLEPEENPALGYRAIRICFAQPDMFKTQLRAIYRASAFGNIGIMFPMITSVWEVCRCKAAAAEAVKELTSCGIHTGIVELGIMVETPAAALISCELAQEVDFFSVGTNDLIQYTLAADRQNEKLAVFADPHHPAILRLLKMIAENAHEAGIWTGICGELAADPELTYEFLKMGYDELSVSPAFILELRKRIRNIELS